MKNIFKSYTLASGLALFSMFFGAGNVTFPLIVGHYAGSQNSIAMLGLFITAVIMPIIGLISMILFDCKYLEFFNRLGRFPGTLLIILSAALIGPFMGIPRTVTVAYSTLNYQLIDWPIWLFSLIFLVVVYFCSYKKNRIVDIIGLILTPALILLILTVVIVGMLNPIPITEMNKPVLDVFWYGLVEGYNTLDLVASLFFSSVILYSIKQKLPDNIKNDRSKLISSCVKAGVIGGGLLGLVYLGISYVSAMYANSINFNDTDTAQLLAALLQKLLGDVSAPISSTIVTLACFTTAVGLAAVITDLVHSFIKEKYSLSYASTLIIILSISFFDSLLGFSGIMHLVAPLIIICYPVYIVLSICNLLHKMYSVNIIKIPATLAFVGSVYGYIF